MEYKKIQEYNSRLKTVDIKGKKYVEVNSRIQAFRDLFPDARQETEILNFDAEKGTILVKVKVYANQEAEKPIAEGIAYEKESSSFINKTSFVENAETSRFSEDVYGNLGIGIDTAVASAEEVQNAIENQKDKREWQVDDDTPLISTEQVQILKKTVEKYKVSDVGLNELLSKFGYKKLEDVKMSDFAKIGNALSK